MDAKRKAKARILRVQNEVKATIDQAIGPGNIRLGTQQLYGHLAGVS